MSSSISAIENGDVYMFDNPSGCNIISGLAFDNLFVNPGDQRFHNSLALDLHPVDSSITEYCLSTPGTLIIRQKVLYFMAIIVRIQDNTLLVSKAHPCAHKI